MQIKRFITAQKNWNILVFFVFCFFLLYLSIDVIPAKGLDLTDHGYYLYNAYLLSNFFIVPTVGFSAIFNAILILLGVHKYLFFMLFDFWVSVIVCTAFILSFYLGKAYKATLLVWPVVLCAVLASRFTEMLSYQQVPEILFMLGFLFFNIFDSTKKYKHISLILSAVLFSLYIVSSVVFFPMLLMIAITFYFLFETKKEKLIFYTLLFGCSLVLILLYLKSPENIFKAVRVKHDLWGSLINYTLWLIKDCFTIWVIVFIGLLKVIVSKCNNAAEKKYGETFDIVYFVLVIFYTMFLVYQVVCYFHEANFDNLAQLYEDRFLFYSYLYFKIYMLSSTLVFVLFEQCRKKTAILFLNILAATSIMAIATNSIFISHMIYFSSLYVLLIFYFFNYLIQNYKSKIFKKYLKNTFYLYLIISICLLIYIVFTTYLNFSYRNTPMSKNIYKIPEGFYAQLMTDEYQYNALHFIQNFYEINHCSKKTFIVLGSYPLFYVQFKRRAIDDMAWFYPLLEKEYQRKYIEKIKEKAAWCVVYPEQSKNGHPIYFEKLLNILASNSKLSIVNYSPKQKIYLYAR
jgi:hypothetical protein